MSILEYIQWQHMFPKCPNAVVQILRQLSPFASLVKKLIQNNALLFRHTFLKREKNAFMPCCAYGEEPTCHQRAKAVAQKPQQALAARPV